MSILAIVVDTHVSTRDSREWLAKLVEKTLRAIEFSEEGIPIAIARIDAMSCRKIDELFEQALADLGVEA